METRTEAPETSASPDEAAPEERKILKILVPVDDSDGSFYALQYALDHLITAAGRAAYDQDSSLITLINVQPIFQPYLYSAGPVVYATPTMIGSVKRAQEQSAASILARALQICKDKKVKAETMILEGDPKDKICLAAEQLHVDLVVVGSRGLGPVKRALLGSVSQYCAHHVHCPVLIVKQTPRLGY